MANQKQLTVSLSVAEKKADGTPFYHRLGSGGMVSIDNKLAIEVSILPNVAVSEGLIKAKENAKFPDVFGNRVDLKIAVLKGERTEYVRVGSAFSVKDSKNMYSLVLPKGVSLTGFFYLFAA